MRNVLLFILLSSCFPVVAQQSFYKEFEVDSAAQPRGGMAYLTTFIQTNLRKPIAAEALGLGGTVIVNGIVEPDGHISSVNVLKSFRPDCDREAVRVFGLYNAWKPAKKDGKVVRQVVNIPVVFRKNEPFIYANGNRISYFDEEQKSTPDSSKAYYKQITPLDSIGLPAGDIVLYKSIGKKWKEVSRSQLVRKNSTDNNWPGKSVYRVGYLNSVLEIDGPLAVVDKEGLLLRRVYFQDKKRVVPELIYHPNQAISQKIEEVEGKVIYTYWYPNGQIKQMEMADEGKPLEPNSPEQMMAFWDSAGHQVIKDGTGTFLSRTLKRSEADSTQHVVFIEQGNYQNGFKQGLWRGSYADGSFFYEEQYDKGVCQAGKSKIANGDTLRYKELWQQPEFPGGVQGLGQFLSKHLQYPPNAQKANAEGKVFVSFVVCTDGTLCDYEVIKGVYPDLDREAVRVVKAMSGKWKPGIQRGRKVRVKYNLPINFSLY
jgi:TonB family protein